MIGAIIGKRLVRSQYNLLNQRDIQTFMEGVDEDASFSYPGIVSVSGEIKGKKDMEEWFHKYIEHFPKLNIALKNIFVANIFAMGSTNIFAVEWDETSTNPEGKQLQCSGITIIEVKKGKATRIREYVNDTQLNYPTLFKSQGK